MEEAAGLELITGKLKLMGRLVLKVLMLVGAVLKVRSFRTASQNG